MLRGTTTMATKTKPPQTGSSRRTLRARFETPEKTPRLRIIAATLGPGKVQLLELIESTGSISEAARHMGMSYLQAWQLVETLNASFRHPLIHSGTGGSKGGGSHLTPTGKKAVALYRSIQATCQASAQNDLEKLHRMLNV